MCKGKRGKKKQGREQHRARTAGSFRDRKKEAGAIFSLEFFMRERVGHSAFTIFSFPPLCCSVLLLLVRLDFRPFTTALHTKEKFKLYL